MDINFIMVICPKIYFFLLLGVKMSYKTYNISPTHNNKPSTLDGYHWERIPYSDKGTQHALSSIESLGTMAMFPLSTSDSGTRVMMLYVQSTQMVVMENVERPYIVSDVSPTMASTYDCQVIEDCTVVKVVSMTKGYVSNGKRISPTGYKVIVQNTDNGDYHIYQPTNHMFADPNFAIPTPFTKLMLGLKKGDILKEGDKLNECTNVVDGMPAIMTPANFVNMSWTKADEDGSIVRKGWADAHPTCRSYSSRVKWGNKDYPLSLYPDGKKFGAYPKVGEKVREDGLLIAIRPWSDLFYGIDMASPMLRTPNLDSDVVTRVSPGAIVQKINVDSNIRFKATIPKARGGRPAEIYDRDEVLRRNRPFNQLTETIMRNATITNREIASVHDEILERENRHVRFKDGKENEGGKCSPELISAMTYALNRLAVDGIDKSTGLVYRPVELHYKGASVGEYSISFQITKSFPIEKGQKITGTHGDKTTIVEILPDSQMPRTEGGVVADIIRQAHTVSGRQNSGQEYEAYIGATARELTTHVKATRGTIPDTELFEPLYMFYTICNKRLKKFYDEFTEDDIVAHLDHICQEGGKVQAILTVGNLDGTDRKIEDHAGVTLDTVIQLRNVLPIERGSLYYDDIYGQPQVTENAILMGNRAVGILDKSKLKPIAISNSTLQLQGLANGRPKINCSQLTIKGVKILCETDVRYQAGMCGGLYVKFQMMIHNSPDASKEVMRRIFNAPHPSKIPKMLDIVDKKSAKSRTALQLAQVLFCAGIRLHEEGEIENV